MRAEEMVSVDFIVIFKRAELVQHSSAQMD